MILDSFERFVDRELSTATPPWGPRTPAEVRQPEAVMASRGPDVPGLAAWLPAPARIEEGELG